MSRVEIKEILVPTDFSDFSRRALEHAVAVAKLYGSRITALHVWWVPQQPVLAEYPAPAPASSKSDVEVRAALEAFLEPARAAGLETAMRTPEGDPVRIILEEAKHCASDLIVLGTHGRSGFDRLVLGSVTEKVLRKATCPVLTVPRPAEASSRGPGRFSNILCPVDFSKPSGRALDYALSLAAEAQGRLTVLHVLEWLGGETGEPWHLNLREYQTELKADAARRLAGLVPPQGKERVAVKETVLMGRPWQRILETAGQVQADLIVMGCAGRSAVDLMLFGSTTQHVVREATCPVLTLRS